MKSKKVLSAIFSIIFLIFIDQFSKYLIRLKDGFYVCNPNISWSIRIPVVIFWAIWIIIIIFVLVFAIYQLKISNGQFPISNKFSKFNPEYSGQNSKFYLISLIFIFSGAISNISDRIIFGCVIDFIKLPLFPAFNLADVFITVGAALLLAKWIEL